MSACKIQKTDNSVNESSLLVVCKPFNATDPLSLQKWPQERIVRKALQILSKAQGNTLSVSQRDKGVVLGHLGVFTEDSLRMLERLSTITQTKRDFEAEKRWLSEDDGVLTTSQKDEIVQVLGNNPPDECVAKHKEFVISVNSLAYFVEERYLDNFSIDFMLAKYRSTLDKARSVICLPSYFKDMACGSSVDNDRLASIFKSHKNDCKSDKLRFVFLPIHMCGCHWGLVVIDVYHQLCYFDDGMKYRAPSEASKIVRIVLKLIEETFYISLTGSFNGQFKRFGMPRQMTGSTSGSGSCGVGVVLAAKTFMEFAETASTPGMHWSFKDSKSLRKKLMPQIVQWNKLSN